MSHQIDAVDFYWRRGCGFCTALDRGLRRAGIPMNKKDIWENPADAAFVRSVAEGNETVPTVVVGTTALVNPRASQVIDALQREAPHLAPESATESGPMTRLTQRLFGDT